MESLAEKVRQRRGGETLLAESDDTHRKQLRTTVGTDALSSEVVSRISIQHSSTPSPYPLPQNACTRANYRYASSTVRSGGEETMTGERETR